VTVPLRQQSGLRRRRCPGPEPGFARTIVLKRSWLDRVTRSRDRRNVIATAELARNAADLSGAPATTAFELFHDRAEAMKRHDRIVDEPCPVQ
jgi:hypothetical protein